jgi:cytoskeletal protein CcmA (bactofilin family)
MTTSTGSFGSGSSSSSGSVSGGAATGMASALGGTDKVEAFLGKGSKVVGTLTFTGPVELDGYVEGEIVAQDRLTIGESAVINARISGGEILVKGTVNGDITASKRLSLKRPARVIGNINCTNLSIEEGVIFEGKASMGAAAKSGDGKGSGPRLAGGDKAGAVA